MPFHRFIIFCFQIVAITGLLSFAPDSAGSDDDDDAYQRSCNNPANAELDRCLPQNRPNTIPIPWRYRNNPPDEGFRYTSNDDDGGGGSVWVPGLTDNMTAANKQVYSTIKGQTAGIVWRYQRKDVAGMIQYVQDNPKTKCKSQVNSTATAVAMVCQTPGKERKVFPNMVASMYDQYFDENMITPVEEFQMAHEKGGTHGPTASHTSGPGSQTSRVNEQYSAYSSQSAAAATFGASGGNGSSSSSGSGRPSSVSSAYSSYISSQVGPNNNYAARPIDPVFANMPDANSNVTTIEDEKARYSQDISGTSARASVREGSTQNGSTTFGGNRGPASAPPTISGSNPLNAVVTPQNTNP